MNTQQFETALIDEFFSMLNQQAQPVEPRRLAAAQSEPPRPYYVEPKSVIERQQIEAQLRTLVEASTARLYEMLVQRLDELKAQQQAVLESERQRRIEARISPPCTPARGSWY